MVQMEALVLPLSFLLLEYNLKSNLKDPILEVQAPVIVSILALNL